MLPVLTFVFAGSVFVYLAARFLGKTKIKGQVVFIFSFGFLGGVLGYSAGYSRVPVVGTILPALLTFVTALLGYLFSKDQLETYRPLIPYCIVVLLLNSFYGLSVGSIMRGKFDDFERDYQKRLLYYERVELESKKALCLKQIQDTGKADADCFE
jgi:4-hydroxybenzoate polyprenyltransferase